MHLSRDNPNISIILAAFILLINGALIQGYDETQLELKPREICPFKDTVDLTDYEPYENGSYLYHNILIPDTKISAYNYTIQFRYKERETDSHLRGCVCGNPKRCIKLCCEIGQFFNEDTYECEDIPENFSMPNEMNMVMADGHEDLVNIFNHFIPQVGRPCDEPESLTHDGDSWALTEKGELHVYNDDQYLDILNYCLSPYRKNNTDKYDLVALSCPMPNEPTFVLLLNTYAMAISVVFLVPTVLIYLSVYDLRCNMRGKLLICYLISLIGCYTIISFINISGAILDEKTCSALGFTCYFFFMAAFLWLNVLCFDIWINFKDHQVVYSKHKQLFRFLWYSLYAWGTAYLLTGLTIWSQFSSAIPEYYKPGIGVEICWIDTDKWAAGIYFYWPNLIIIFCNIVTFAHLSMRIYRIRRNIGVMTQKQKFLHENGVVILRLFIVMGISWIMDIISFCLRYYKWANHLFMVTDFCNAIQGVSIFALFVLKGNVFESIKKCFGTTPTIIPRRSITFSTTFTKVSTNSSAH
ncbi:G-protein coupled receptor Mth2-like [Haematobia irritans]|uniref:G-protein coupled receptor Mth2-like n=1 Tax=Haematobia irritans TaxID=7368 RepID=UPI003F501AA6